MWTVDKFQMDVDLSRIDVSICISCSTKIFGHDKSLKVLEVFRRTLQGRAYGGFRPPSKN